MSILKPILNQLSRLMIALVLSGLIVPVTHACEPAAVDWQLLDQRYDRNHDGRYSRDEFARINDLPPFDWPREFAGPLGHQRLFKRLDRNKNGQIEEQEFFEIYSWLPNPCAGWPWSNRG